MHGRTFLADLVVRLGLTTAAGCLVPAGLPLAVAFAAERAAPPIPFALDPADVPAVDALFDAADDIDMTTLDREDWRPAHAAAALPAAKPAEPKPAKLQQAQSQQTKSQQTKSQQTKSQQTKSQPALSTPVSQDDKIFDPEPDAAIVPPAASPSHDPLDKPQPAPAAGPAPDPAAAPAVPLPPQDAAIKAALDKRAAAPLKGPGITEKRKERDAIAFFYAAHGFAPAWSEGGKPVAAVDPVLARLAQADEDALRLPATPKSLVVTGTPDAIADSDIALTEAVVAYARQATGSRIDPHAISPLIGAKPDLADPAEVLDAVIAAGPQAGDTLHAQNPSEARYVALRDQLAEMRGPRDAHAAIPAGPTLKLGMHDPRVPALRARFDLGAGDGMDDPTLYDSALAVAVADFQQEHGIVPSGRLTPRTVVALSGGSRSSAAETAIVANMEMWRWMPRDLGADRIEVNVPDFVVRVFHDGEPVAENKVVVGKTETPTPLFSNVMKYLIVNPVWNVPQSIIKKELLPKGGGSLSYLSDRGYNVSYKHGEYTVQQVAGAKNALGRIKFIFPNDYSVYLHDTPSKSFFSATTRAFSHGCVRVDQPFDFAESVLNDGVPEGGRVLWNQKRLDKMLGDKERYVNLPKPLPIHIEYFTASVDPETGRLRQRPDIYGYTHAVAAALGLTQAEPVAVVERKPRHVAERASRPAADVVVDTDPR